MVDLHGNQMHEYSLTPPGGRAAENMNLYYHGDNLREIQRNGPGVPIRIAEDGSIYGPRPHDLGWL